MATKSAAATKPANPQPSLLASSLAKGKAISQDRDVRNMAKGVGIAVLGYCVFQTIAAR